MGNFISVSEDDLFHLSYFSSVISDKKFTNLIYLEYITIFIKTYLNSEDYISDVWRWKTIYGAQHLTSDTSPEIRLCMPLYYTCMLYTFTLNVYYGR